MNSIIKWIGWELEGGTISQEDLNCEVMNLKRKLSHAVVGSDSSAYVDDSKLECSELEVRLGGDVDTVLDSGCKLMEKKLIVQGPECGNHVHVCFNKEYHTKLWTWEESQQMFLRAYRQQFRCRDRYLNRESNSYSYGGTYELGKVLAQLQDYDNERYKAINCGAIEKHGSIEFRIMPYFESADEAMKSLRWLIDTVVEITISGVNSLGGISQHINGGLKRISEKVLSDKIDDEITREKKFDKRVGKMTKMIILSGMELKGDVCV